MSWCAWNTLRLLTVPFNAALVGLTLAGMLARMEQLWDCLGERRERKRPRQARRLWAVLTGTAI